jgi:hypothetical protein
VQRVYNMVIRRSKEEMTGSMTLKS